MVLDFCRLQHDWWWLKSSCLRPPRRFQAVPVSFSWNSFKFILLLYNSNQKSMEYNWQNMATCDFYGVITQIQVCSMFPTPDVLVVGETTPIWRNPTERLLPSKLVGAVLTTSKQRSMSLERKIWGMRSKRGFSLDWTHWTEHLRW